MWETKDTNISIQTLSAGSSPTIPVTPGVIVTATSQAQQGLGYSGLTSTTANTIGTGPFTFTTNINANATAFITGDRIRVINTTSNWMEGTITSFTGTTLRTSTLGWVWGTNSTGASNQLEGKIAITYAWERVLSPNEIMQVFLAHKQRFLKP